MAPEVVDAELLPPPAVSPAGASPATAADTAEGAILDLSVVEKDNADNGRRRLIPTEVRLILELRANGLSQRQIAGRLNVNQSTVARWLAAFDDNRALAKARLRGAALELADRVIDRANAEEAIKVLEGLDVLQKSKGDGGAVKVIVGVAMKTTGG